MGRLDPVNSSNYYERGIRPSAAVIAYCPPAVKIWGGSTWWHEWRAPHMDKPWLREIVTIEPVADSRNYLFTDGHAVLINFR